MVETNLIEPISPEEARKKWKVLEDSWFEQDVRFINLELISGQKFIRVERLNNSVNCEKIIEAFESVGWKVTIEKVSGLGYECLRFSLNGKERTDENDIENSN